MVAAGGSDDCLGGDERSCGDLEPAALWPHQAGAGLLGPQAHSQQGQLDDCQTPLLNTLRRKPVLWIRIRRARIDQIDVIFKSNFLPTGYCKFHCTSTRSKISQEGFKNRFFKI